MTKIVLPVELEAVREAAKRAIAPIKPADASSRAAKEFLFTSKRADASRYLPPYYLNYFLLVDLLGFRNLGRFEKLDWSVPIDLDGVAYVASEEQQAKRIVALIKKGVKAAAPFFKWMADNAVLESKINVRNVGLRLFERYVYLRESFRTVSAEASARHCGSDFFSATRRTAICLPP